MTGRLRYVEIECAAHRYAGLIRHGTASYLEVLAFDDAEQDQWSQELRLAGAGFDGRLNWVVGGYWFEEDASMPLVVPLFRGVAIPTPAQLPIFYAPTPPGFPAATFGELALTIR